MCVFVHDVSIFCKETFLGVPIVTHPFFGEDKNHSLSEAFLGEGLAEVTPV